MGQALFPTRWKNDKPPSIETFVETFRDDYRVHRAEIMGNLSWWVERLREEDPRAYAGFRWDFHGVPEFSDRRSYARRKAKRPVLMPRRTREERPTGRRYSRPDALVPRILPKDPRAVGQRASPALASGRG